MPRFRGSMRQRRAAAWLSLAMLLMMGGITDMSQAQTQPAKAVAKYDLFEITFDIGNAALPANPFWDVSASAVFTAPSGKKIELPGFYYGAKQWRIRFVPRELGQWQYEAVLNGAPDAKRQAGSFTCEGTAGHGFLKLSQRNCFRMEYDDGTPFYPIGIQTCSFLQPDFDGPNEQGSWRNTTPENWAKEFAGAVNLVRTQLGQGTRAGCALALIPDPTPPGRQAASSPAPPVARPPLDRYDTDLAAKMDDVFRIQRKAGISQILILFQDMSLWGGGGGAFGGGRDLTNNKSLQAANLPMQEKYIRYALARFGCFVDIWEIFNEDSFAPDDYLARLAEAIKKADPYGHIVTTNYARPKAAWCQLTTFHEYMGMPANEVDAYLSQLFALYKSYGKCVQNTEFGNQGQLSNYDPVKWRIAVWTAYMNECGLLFWGMSGSKTKAGNKEAKGNANAYIGPDSRQHFRVLNDLTRDLPIDMRPVAIGYHEHTDIRTSALSNGQFTLVYIHHFADHARQYQLPYKLMCQTGPGKFRLKWIDPEDGKEVKTEELSTVQQFLEFKPPPVKVDLACRIERQ